MGDTSEERLTAGVFLQVEQLVAEEHQLDGGLIIFARVVEEQDLPGSQATRRVEVKKALQVVPILVQLASLPELEVPANENESLDLNTGVAKRFYYALSC